MKRILSILTLNVFFSLFLSACTDQTSYKSGSVTSFLTEAYNSGNYGKDFYGNIPIVPISDNEVMLLGNHTFVPYDENNIISIVAEILDTPDEVAVAGYVGPCSYRHKKICMYNTETNEINDLFDIEDGYAGGLAVHDDNILEYHCGSLMYTETVCLYDIANKKNHKVCTYEPSELEVISTLSDKLYNDGKFYYMRLYDDESKELRLYEYDLNSGISEPLNADGLPCIYNNNVCYKKFNGDTIQLSDVHTQEQLAVMTPDDILHSVYSSDYNEYYDSVILNNVVKKLYRIDSGELTEYAVPDDELTDLYRIFFHTSRGAYVYSVSNDDNSNAAWHYIAY